MSSNEAFKEQKKNAITLISTCLSVKGTVAEFHFGGYFRGEKAIGVVGNCEVGNVPIVGGVYIIKLRGTAIDPDTKKIYGKVTRFSKLDIEHVAKTAREMRV